MFILFFIHDIPYCQLVISLSLLCAGSFKIMQTDGDLEMFMQENGGVSGRHCTNIITRREEEWLIARRKKRKWQACNNH